MGPICERMTSEERAYARDKWQELIRLWGKVCERSAWLYDNQSDEDWDEINERTNRVALKMGRVRDELLEWCGIGARDVLQFTRLMVSCAE